MTLDNKTTTHLILIIMALTWSIISIRVGVMVAVSDNFMVLAMALGSGLVGNSLADKFIALRGGK